MYSRDHDTITITITPFEFDQLLLTLGYALSHALERNRAIARDMVLLANSINLGNPTWTPYKMTEDEKKH